MSGACSALATGWPGIAVLPGSAHSLPGRKINKSRTNPLSGQTCFKARPEKFSLPLLCFTSHIFVGESSFHWLVMTECFSNWPQPIQPSTKRETCGSMPLLPNWMNDLRFYVLFNSISVISGRRMGGNERLCALKSRLPLKRSSNPGLLYHQAST